MFEGLPERLDPVVAADRQRTYSGQIPINKLPRLEGLLAGYDGSVSVELRFFRNGRRNLLMVGRCQGELQLRCQRCMELFSLEIDQPIELGVVGSELQAQRLPDGLDPFLLEEEKLLVADVVSDEILLVLPSVPRHPEGACSLPDYDIQAPVEEEMPEEEPEEPKENPFAVLSQLKKDDAH